jgi:hypothetical protein
MCARSSYLQLPFGSKIATLRYSQLVETLYHYTNVGWIGHVFPWVVGIRGLIDPSHIHGITCPCLDFLRIPGKCWKLAVERTIWPPGVDNLYTALAANRQQALAAGRVAHKKLAGVDCFHTARAANWQPAPAGCVVCGAQEACLLGRPLHCTGRQLAAGSGRLLGDGP